MTTLIEPQAETHKMAPDKARPAVVTRNMSNICVGGRLRVRRASRGMSEKELSEKLGTRAEDIGAYEEGLKRISANLLLRIAKLLDVRPEYFFQDYTQEELSYCLKS